MELGFYSFNSLFEMPLGAELFPIGDPREPFNSLFEMRRTTCLASATTSSMLSILYLRCPCRRSRRERCGVEG